VDDFSQQNKNQDFFENPGFFIYFILN